MRESAELRTGSAATTMSADTEAAPSRCPVDHRALAAAAAPPAPEPTTGGCPVDHGAPQAADGAETCPFVHVPADGAERSAADVFMRRLLRIPDHPKRVRKRDVDRLFSTSILISAVRCLLSYVVFPILAPTLGALTKVGAAIGIPIGIIALVFDVRAVRRFWLANHKYRWPFTIVYGIVILLVSTLFVRDLRNLLV